MTMREAIKRARMEMGLTQKELAELVGVAQTNVSQWESGGTRPKARNLVKLSQALNKPVDYLVGDAEFWEDDGVDSAELEAVQGGLSVPPDSVMVPLLATIPMGDPQEAVEVTDEFIRTTPAEAASCDFAFRVVGNSMYPFFWDGDMVGVKTTKVASDRQVVVARVEPGETTLKMYRENPATGNAWLEPLNKSHRPLRSRDFVVTGIVVWIRKSLPGGRVPRASA